MHRLRRREQKRASVHSRREFFLVSVSSGLQTLPRRLLGALDHAGALKSVGSKPKLPLRNRASHKIWPVSTIESGFPLSLRRTPSEPASLDAIERLRYITGRMATGPRRRAASVVIGSNGGSS